MDIILADDHALVRDGLKPFLEELAEIVTILEAESFEHMQRVALDARDLKLIIMDLDMPGVDGLSGVRRILDAHPNVPVVILSGTHDQGLILRAFTCGISGFIPKSAGSEVLLSALKLVMAGERYIPSQILVGAALGQQTDSTTDTIDQNSDNDDTGLSAESLARFDNLSKREQRVLELLVSGMTNKEIARAINLQEATIKIHVKNIYRKMGVSNRAQAVRMAIQPSWTGAAPQMMHT